MSSTLEKSYCIYCKGSIEVTETYHNSCHNLMRVSEILSKGYWENMPSYILKGRREFLHDVKTEIDKEIHFIGYHKGLLGHVIFCDYHNCSCFKYVRWTFDKNYQIEIRHNINQWNYKPNNEDWFKDVAYYKNCSYQERNEWLRDVNNYPYYKIEKGGYLFRCIVLKDNKIIKNKLCYTNEDIYEILIGIKAHVQ